MTDLLITTVPIMLLDYPPAAPAIIKACVESAGFKANTLDFNLLLRKVCKTSQKFYEVLLNFETISSKDFYTSNNVVDVFFDNHKEIIKNWLDLCVEEIKKINPIWLGISVFTYRSHKATIVLCDEVKRHLPNVKIVLGGRGTSSYSMGPDHKYFNHRLENLYGQYPELNFGETLLHYKLIDNLIQGDGENEIIKLLKNSGNNNNVKGNVEEIDLETIPYVDYSDYELDQYEYINDPILPITGSKGCVRKCTFCDIPTQWPKYKFRSGEHIANEMIYLSEKHGIKKFYMTDSLVNGSLKAFIDFITVLGNYNQKNPSNKLTWTGQYIARPISNALNDEYYDLIKKSGGEGLSIGVETGSDVVRAHMRKHFKTVDIDAEIEQFDRRGIVCVLLFFSCYPTERWVDFLDTVDMLIRYQKYCASGTIYKLTLGIPYIHDKGTALWEMAHDMGMEVDPGNEVLWKLNKNKELTFTERARRRLILQEVGLALGLPLGRTSTELNQIHSTLTLHKADLESFFGNETVPIYPNKYNILEYENLLMPVDIQEKIKQHLDLYPDNLQKIKNIHTNISDADRTFESNAYLTLKKLIRP